MTEEELRAFLDRPLAAIVGTVDAKGHPHSVPVWYRYDGSAFVIWTTDSRAWVRNVQRNPQVSIVVAENDFPFAAVIAKGAAEVTTDAPDTDEEIRAISRRYLGEDAVEDYARSWASLRTIVRVRPRTVHAWGRGY